MPDKLSHILVASILILVATTLRAAEPATKPATAPAFANVDAEEFQKLLARKGIVLLDVRTPAEFTQGHLDGAININFHARDFPEQVQKLDKDKTYLVYCAVGGRSTTACEKMSKFDFPSLVNLKGGIEAWKRVGKPVVQ